MATKFDGDRRRLLGLSALTMVSSPFAFSAKSDAKGYSPLESHAKASEPSSFSTVREVRAGVLSVAFADLGPAHGPAVLLVHGWPYDIHTYADVAPILADAGYRVIVPYLRGYGGTLFLSNQTPRNGQQAAFAVDMIALLDTLGIEKVILGGCDWGARTVNIMAAIWPERCRAMVSVSGYLIGSQAVNRKPLSPEAELSWWYQFYFATERGRLGYKNNTHGFAKLIWRQASPTWRFDEATFSRTAAALDNPDHVEITIHNYRWRLGLASGEQNHDALEKRLSTMPIISIPTITMEGDANGAPHPKPSSYSEKFSGPYQHRNLNLIGHNLPQEAPREFAQAVMDVTEL